MFSRRFSDARGLQACMVRLSGGEDVLRPMCSWHLSVPGSGICYACWLVRLTN